MGEQPENGRAVVQRRIGLCCAGGIEEDSEIVVDPIPGLGDDFDYALLERQVCVIRRKLARRVPGPGLAVEHGRVFIEGRLQVFCTIKQIAHDHIAIVAVFFANSRGIGRHLYF